MYWIVWKTTNPCKETKQFMVDVRLCSFYFLAIWNDVIFYVHGLHCLVGYFIIFYLSYCTPLNCTGYVGLGIAENLELKEVVCMNFHCTWTLLVCRLYSLSRPLRVDSLGCHYTPTSTEYKYRPHIGTHSCYTCHLQNANQVILHQHPCVVPLPFM